MTKRISEIREQIKKYTHLKCANYILVLSVIILAISWVVHNETISSVLQNVFAGLITGLVIMLISGIKSKELKDIEIKKAFYDEINARYTSAKGAYWGYQSQKKSDDDVFHDAAYDAVCEMQSFDNYISQMDQDNIMSDIFRDKPSEHFKMMGKYNIDEQMKRYEQLKNILDSYKSFDEDIRNEIYMIIREIQISQMVVKHIASTGLPTLSREKTEIERTIL